MELAGRLALNATDVQIHTTTFENYYVGNKFDVIVMNPPFSVSQSRGEDQNTAARHLRAALDFGTSLMAVPFFLPFRRLNGLRLVAADLGWSHGSGALIEGPAQELALAMFGRVAAAAPSLSGPGVEVLARRCS